MKGLDMQSTVTTLVRQRDCSKTFNSPACVATIGLVGFAMTASPASALVGGADSSLRRRLKQNSQLTEIVVRRGGAVRRTTVVRPARYYWPAGGAVAAGVAIGLVAAATAAAWAGAPPAPGYCRYYTDPGRTQGFWACPH
jgi:hypothetical protein